MYRYGTYYDVDIEFSLDFLAVFVVAGVLDIFGWFEKATDAFFDSVSAHLAVAILIFPFDSLIFFCFFTSQARAQLDFLTSESCGRV